MNVSKSRSAALYQTEYTHIMVDARLRSIMDAGCDEYEIDENMDSDICDECASMHGKHFKLSEYQQGITAPPFHTRCRGTITGYFVEEEETLRNLLNDFSQVEGYKVLVHGGGRSGGLCDVRLVWPCFMASRSGQYGGL